MKRGKDDDKMMGPMFPRLHVNDTGKGGPRAPPRNKMALYEQLTIPSQPRFNSGAHHNSNNTMAPSTSTMQGTGHEQSMYFPLYRPPLASSYDEVQVSRPEVVDARNRPVQGENWKQQLEEDDFMVPIFSQPGIKLQKKLFSMDNQLQQYHLFALHNGWLFSATKLVNPFFALLDPEVAHRLAVSAAARGWVPREKRPDPSILELEVWGRKFSNPIGLAAGFDKNAEAVEGLLGLGYGFVEVGSVTPVPQEGNPKPRIFRLREERAIINRCGFNSEGIQAVAKRLGAQHGKRKLDESSSTSPTANDGGKPGGKAGPGILGVNLGKNKTSEDAAYDYVQGVHTLSQYADYLVINVSSPNTPGLRQLQGRKQLKDLVKKVQAARDEMQWGDEGPPPLLVKIAPDLSKQDLEDIAAVALALQVDGLIISNTTISRPDSISQNPLSQEVGGLSGKPLFDLSTSVLKEMYNLTRGKIPLIGCGGVGSGEEAYKKIRAGATLVQLYTAFAYGGPALIPRIKAELAECLEKDGYKSVHEAVGADCI